MHVQISCISRFKIETYLIDQHLTSNTTNSAADSELQPRTAVTSLLLPACGLRDNLSSSVRIASGASLVFLPDSRCWVLTISSRPHCAGPGQNQRPFSRKVASLTPTLPLRPQTFVSSSLSCLVFFFFGFFFSLSLEGQSWRVYNQSRVTFEFADVKRNECEVRRGEMTLLLQSALSHVRV